MAALVCFIASTPVYADSGDIARADARHSGTIFTALIPDIPGKRLTIFALEYAPRSTSPPRSVAHRHPGPVYVYVTRGTIRLGIEGQPAQVFHAGEIFSEPTGALHTVSENASDTEPASAIAIMIIPDGAPLLTVETQDKK